MSKKAKKPKKLDAVTQAAKDLAVARRRLDLAGKRREKALEELARSISESNDAAIETARAEFDFEEAAIGQARKRFGLPEEGEVSGIGVSFSGIKTDCTCYPPLATSGDFTFSIAKPPEQLQRELEANRYARGLGK